MEGCALFAVFAVALGALIVASIAAFQLRDAREDIRTLGHQLGALQRIVAEMRRQGVAPEPEPEPVVAPSPTPAPALPRAPEPAPEPEPIAATTPPPPPPTEPAPAPPAKPAFTLDWENLVGIKLFSWIAGIALVLAAVFFLKYSVEHGWLSPAVRATLGIITGATLVVICEMRVARGYAFTANAMHGAGIAILYATLFAIHALWRLLPPGVVFFLMLIVTAVAVWLSIRRDSMFIALLGMMGGFATPALLSTGENRPVGLFSYLLLLNAGLAWVAYRKRWPALTLGSVVFTVFYQWGWVSTYLTADQLPLAVAIFLVFAAMAAAALWIERRDARFDRIALAAAVLPLAFGIFAAAVPAYGARVHTLFGFLLLVAAGLAVIAVVRRHAWLHAIGGAAVLLTFAIWSAVSYAPAAWPAILGWIAAFVALYLAVATRLQTFANLTAPLLFFMLPALIALEPRTASPALVFATFLVLLAATTFVPDPLYPVAASFVVIGEVVWTAQHLDRDTLTAALVLYAGFGLFFLVRRRDRTAHFALSAFVFLMVVAARNELAFPPWPFFIALAILTIVLGLTARPGSLMIASAAAAQLVLLTWSAHTLVPPWANVGLAATLLVAAFFLITRRAAAVALLLGHVVAIAIGVSSNDTLFEPLLVTHALLAIATLAMAWRTERHALALWSVALTIAAAFAARPIAPGRDFVFAAVLYALYILYPLSLGARVRQSLHPHLAAVIASAAFFFFARDSMMDLGYEPVIGVLPLAQAVVMLLLLWQLLRVEPAEARQLGRLAMTAGAALAFITVAIPLQLDKEWITIAWALEGAALVWLFTRIPHRGLVAWAAGLLIAVFVRLVFNPNVFGYHPAEHRVIFNWYMYTYLVPAASFYAAAYWLPRAWKRSIAAASAMGTVLLFVLLNIEIADFYATGPALTFNFFSSSLAQELTYTMGWAVFAIAMLIAGIVMHARAARVAALVLLLITILKCFLHDLQRLGGLYRVGSLLGLALALVIVGVLLQKYVIAKPAASEPVAAPD